MVHLTAANSQRNLTPRKNKKKEAAAVMAQ
jgi:hypothetical protein